MRLLLPRVVVGIVLLGLAFLLSPVLLFVGAIAVGLFGMLCLVISLMDLGACALGFVVRGSWRPISGTLMLDSGKEKAGTAFAGVLLCATAAGLVALVEPSVTMLGKVFGS